MADTGFSLEMMTADRLAAGGGDFEPQRTNNGMLYIEGMNDGDLLQLSLETFPLPKQSNGLIEMDFINEKRKVAGKVIIDDLEVQFKDFVDRETAKVLWDWRLLVYNPVTGQIGLARNYKKNGIMTLFAPDGSYQRIWELKGLWPMNMDPGDIDMAGEDIVRINMSIAIDKAVFTQPSAVSA